MRPRSIRGPAWLLLPGSALLVFLLVLPVLYVAEQSFREYIPGRVGAAQDRPYTLHNYLELVHPVYLRYLAAMIRIGLISTLAGVALAYPIAYFIARRRAARLRTVALGFLVAFLFLSVLVRVYSLELSFGPVGLGPVLSALLGVSPNSREYAEFLVIIGLMHHNVPLSALLLIGTIQNVATLAGLTGIRPSLREAAMTLGASERQVFWDITFPLAKTGIVAGCVFAFASSLDDVAVSVFLYDPDSYTLPIALISYMRANFDLSVASAAVFLAAITFVLVLVLDRAVGLDKIMGQGIYRT
jgi:ABC-type spermidine/putrescine transport system permease subunit I